MRRNRARACRCSHDGHKTMPPPPARYSCHDGHEGASHEGHEGHEEKPKTSFVTFVTFVAKAFVPFVAERFRALRGSPSCLVAAVAGSAS